MGIQIVGTKSSLKNRLFRKQRRPRFLRGINIAKLFPVKSEARLRARLDAQDSEIAALRAAVTAIADSVNPVALTTDVQSWAKIAQAGELAFHKKPGIRAATDWAERNTSFWRQHGFEPSGWEGKVVVDVGAGSRLRTLFFFGAKIEAIEPLGDKFIAEVPWQDLDQANRVYSIPAEQDIPEQHGRADLVVSVNVLDHCFDFEQVVLNIRKFLKPEGLAWLSFDQHEKPDKMHPLVLNDRVARTVFERVGLKVEKATEGGRYHKGIGASSLHYWLRPV